MFFNLSKTERVSVIRKTERGTVLPCGTVILRTGALRAETAEKFRGFRTNFGACRTFTLAEAKAEFGTTAVTAAIDALAPVKPAPKPRAARKPAAKVKAEVVTTAKPKAKVSKPRAARKPATVDPVEVDIDF